MDAFLSLPGLLHFVSHAWQPHARHALDHAADWLELKVHVGGRQGPVESRMTGTPGQTPARGHAARLSVSVPTCLLQSAACRHGQLRSTALSIEMRGHVCIMCMLSSSGQHAHAADSHYLSVRHARCGSKACMLLVSLAADIAHGSINVCGLSAEGQHIM